MPQRRKNSTLFAELGPGGLSSLSLAFATGALGLGLPVLWRMRRVLATARGGRGPQHADAILVLGRELARDRPTEVFRARLEHGARLWREGWAPLVIVSGGMTGRATLSEARAGQDFLVAAGLPREAIWTEDASRHTLENLYFAREHLRQHGWSRLLLVSDPLHLERAATLARGLGLDVACAPAVASPPRRGSASWWKRAFHEAFLLHWYHVGLAYSRAIRSERMLERVT
jgi:uncharacterized SAM-binding protein YcdF (DUF218 family)